MNDDDESDALFYKTSCQARETRSSCFGEPCLCPQHLLKMRGHELSDEGVSTGRGPSPCDTVYLGWHEAQCYTQRGDCGVLPPADLCPPPWRSQDSGHRSVCPVFFKMILVSSGGWLLLSWHGRQTSLHTERDVYSVSVLKHHFVYSMFWTYQFKHYLFAPIFTKLEGSSVD